MYINTVRFARRFPRKFSTVFAAVSIFITIRWLTAIIKLHQDKLHHDGVIVTQSTKTNGNNTPSSQPLELPQEINDLSLRLSTADSLIAEAQRLHFKILQPLIWGSTKIMLFDIADIQNKGDAAIVVGELNALSKFNVSLVFQCTLLGCHDKKYSVARDIASQYALNDMIVFSSGGGNLGSKYVDQNRDTMIRTFPHHRIIVFSQSSSFHTQPAERLEFTKESLKQHSNLTVMQRDKMSYEFAKSNFPSTTAILAPDMAFSIGRVQRFFPPMYDVVWLNRKDWESVGQFTPNFPAHISFTIQDYLETFRSPYLRAQPISNVYVITYTGMLFLQRGRVVVTDRLHGHILSVLLDIPTVIIDNRIKKISRLRDTWTRGLEKVVMASNADQAVVMAQELLVKYKHHMPRRAPLAGFM